MEFTDEKKIILLLFWFWKQFFVNKGSDSKSACNASAVYYILFYFYFYVFIFKNSNNIPGDFCEREKKIVNWLFPVLVVKDGVRSTIVNNK